MVAATEGNLAVTLPENPSEETASCVIVMCVGEVSMSPSLPSLPCE